MLQKAAKEKRSPEARYVYGLMGLAGLIGCSKPTAQKIKDSGRIPFVQIGRKIIFNEDKVMEALTITGKEVQNG